MAEENVNAVAKESVPLPELKINKESDSKAEIRTKVWDYMSDNKLISFPWPPHKRIPNFKGAEEAGDKATTVEVFGKSQVIKVDPDKPLQAVRIKALEAKKTLLVPIPRLRYGFLNKIVPPEDADEKQLKLCSTRQGFAEHSKPVGLDENVRVDLLIVGAVAVSPRGWRIGKGEGYSDLEHAVLAAVGSVDANTPIVAVVHDCQVIDLPDKVFLQYDVPVDYIVTPTRVIKCDNRPQRPTGIIWSLLDAEKVNAIPILRKLRYREWKAGKDVKLSGETEAPTDLQDEELKMEDDSERRPRQRRGFGRRRFGGRRRGPRESEGGEKGEEGEKNGDGDSRRVNGGGRGRRGGFRGGRRGGRGGRRTVGGRGDSENDGGQSGDEKSASPRRGGFRGGRRGGFRPRRRFDDYEGSVYVGSLPRSLRVSDFKGEVRDRKVNPLRVMWRGSSGFAFLNFKTKDEAEEALQALEGLTFNDKSPRLEMAKERERRNGPGRRRQRADSGSGGEDGGYENGGD